MTDPRTRVAVVVGNPKPGSRTLAAGRYLARQLAGEPDLVEQYAAVGIDEFILSGYPHLEEAYWFGEGVLPVLAERGLWQHPAPSAHASTAVPFGAKGAAT